MDKAHVENIKRAYPLTLIFITLFFDLDYLHYPPSPFTF